MPGNYSISKYRSGPSGNRAFGAIAGKEHMERGRIKVMGIAKTSFLVAFWVASANFRLIDAFEREQRRVQDPDRMPYSPRKPRKRRAVPYADRKTKDPPDNKGPSKHRDPQAA